MAEIRKILDAVARHARCALSATGRTLAEGYEAIDPDVRRHVAQTPLLAYSLLGPHGRPVVPLSDDGYPPLVFVHGLGGSSGDFLPMALFLRAHGRKRSYRVHFAAERSLYERADDLVTYIGEVLDANGAAQVDVVAHSLGGVIARLAIARGGLEAHVRSLTTLGTPHAGTYPARYGATAMVKNLRPGSPAVTELEAHGWPAGVRGATCWSANDVFILPPESAAVEGTEQIDLSPFTHYSYLLSPRSWATVARILNDGGELRGRPMEPGSST